MLPGFMLTPMVRAADKALAATMSVIGAGVEFVVFIVRGPN